MSSPGRYKCHCRRGRHSRHVHPTHPTGTPRKGVPHPVPVVPKRPARPCMVPPHRHCAGAMRRRTVHKRVWCEYPSAPTHSPTTTGSGQSCRTATRSSPSTPPRWTPTSSATPRNRNASPPSWPHFRSSSRRWITTAPFWWGCATHSRDRARHRWPRRRRPLRRRSPRRTPQGTQAEGRERGTQAAREEGGRQEARREEGTHRRTAPHPRLPHPAGTGPEPHHHEHRAAFGGRGHDDARRLPPGAQGRWHGRTQHPRVPRRPRPGRAHQAEQVRVLHRPSGRGCHH